MIPEASGELAIVRFRVSAPFLLERTMGSATTLPGTGRTGQVCWANDAAVRVKMSRVSKNANLFLVFMRGSRLNLKITGAALGLLLSEALRCAIQINATTSP